MTVPNQFANVTTSIPLSQLDANFNTPITLGNTAIQLGNTVSTLNNMTLANVTVTSGNVTITNVTVTTANVTTANIATANVTTSQILNYGTANSVQYLNTSKALTSDANFAYTATGLGIGTSSPAEKLDVVGTYIQAADTRTNNTNKLFGLRMPHYANATAAVNLIGAVSTSGGNALYIGGNDTSFAGTAATSILFYTAATGSVASGTQRMAIDSSGNLGLGVTPSAWASGTFPSVLQLKYGAFAGTGDGNFRIFTNTVYDGSYKYIANGFASRFELSSGGFIAFTAASGTAGNAITFTQAMTLDASGNLGIGTTSPTNTAGYQTIEVNGSSGGIVRASFSTTVKGYYFANSAGVTLGSESNDALMFRTNATERARITSGGDFFVNTTSQPFGSANAKFAVLNTAADYTATIANSNATPYGLIVYYNTDKNDTASEFLYCRGGSTVRATIRSNGGIANYTANNSPLSDRRLKTDIQPAGSYLEKICAIPVVTYLYKDQTDDLPNLGVIAQDVQTAAPELCNEEGWGTKAEDGTNYLGIWETDLHYAVMKAVQELKAIVDTQATRIEAIEAEIAALKGNA